MEFLFDLTLTATARVMADDLNSAVELLRAEVEAYDPGVVLPEHDGVTGRITEISIGTLVKGQPQPDMALVEIDGDMLTDSVVLDDMTRPVVCAQRDDDDGIDCEEVYDEARGDGYAGSCPAHADASDTD